MLYGVGVIGAGPGTSALHLPTLSHLADRFHVVHVADAGSGRSRELARRIDGRASTGTQALLDDPDVDVVLLSSPPQEHAAQILAAVEAGKRAIFTEKPLATTIADAERVIDACRVAGVTLVVGTNHLFDPAWNRTKHHLIGHGEKVQTVTVEIALPPNERLHDLVTELERPAGASAGRATPDLTDPEIAASVVRQLVLGLGVHDLPLLRDLAPHVERVIYARPVAPLGFAIGYLSDGILVQMTAVMVSGGADVLWRMRMTTDADRIEVNFPPAFVHSGSAAVTVRANDGRRTEYSREDSDGYLCEWEALIGLLEGREPVEYDELLDDAKYAVMLADAVAQTVLEGGV